MHQLGRGKKISETLQELNGIMNGMGMCAGKKRRRI